MYDHHGNVCEDYNQPLCEHEMLYTWKANVSRARMQDMAVLGAVISLCLMRGITAAPLDPLFMHFCVHRCGDINAIHPALLEEWHPE